MASETISPADDPTLGPPRMTRLDADDDAEILKLAEEEERPIAQVIRRAVREYLEIRRRAA